MNMAARLVGHPMPSALCDMNWRSAGLLVSLIGRAAMGRCAPDGDGMLGSDSSRSSSPRRLSIRTRTCWISGAPQGRWPTTMTIPVNGISPSHQSHQPNSTTKALATRLHEGGSAARLQQEAAGARRAGGRRPWPRPRQTRRLVAAAGSREGPPERPSGR